jgi:tetratricopeptide (TPR) repeat protein
MNGKFNKDTDYDGPLILTYIGIYYQFVKQPNGFDFKSMEKYYLKALDTKNHTNSNHTDNNSRCYAMYSLGRYYQLIKKYDSMEKYYKMAIGNTNQSNSHYTSQCAMLALGNYYRSIKEPTSYELMKKYYQMTIDFKYNRYSINAMMWLADYYRTIEKNYGLMKKYLEMAIDINNDIINDSINDIIKERVHAMKALGYYYKNIDKNMILMEKYLLMSIELATSQPLKIKIPPIECLSLSIHNLTKIDLAI